MIQGACSGKQNIIGLIKMANYLLDQQIRLKEEDSLKEVGLRERMTLARITERDKQRKENRRD
jgi:four helix bundle suffix protein